MASSPKPDWGFLSPRQGGGVNQALSFRVDDPDAHYAKAKLREGQGGGRCHHPRTAG
jgi:hypothetical protein